MNMSQIFITISIAVLAIVALLVFVAAKDRNSKRLSPLAGLAFGFIIAGIVFGGDRLISYSLMGIGMILSIADIFRAVKSS